MDHVEKTKFIRRRGRARIDVKVSIEASWHSLQIIRHNLGSISDISITLKLYIFLNS